MTTPKSPDTIMEEFCDSNGRLEESKQWLRSSLASLLLYMAERIEKEKRFRTADNAVGRMFSQEECDVWNCSIDGCEVILTEEARRIINE